MNVRTHVALGGPRRLTGMDPHSHVDGRLDERTLGLGRSVDSFDTETMVLHRSQEGWRIVHIHWSSHRVGTE